MRLLIIFSSIIILLSSCKKYLDKKPEDKLQIPTTLSDFQALLDYPDVVEPSSSPGVLDLGCDDYYLSYSAYQALSPVPYNCYTWETDIWNGDISSDWNILYSIIYVSNVVLEGLENFKVDNPTEQAKWNDIYAQALFVRAIQHYYLEETFGQPFTPSTANTDLGIPLKISSELNGNVRRSTVQDVYKQITTDLLEAVKFLPNTSVATSRPSKAAGFALLARVYLSMQDYSKAGAYADSSLTIKNYLYDYNLISNPTTNTNPFSGFRPPNDLNFEVLYPSVQISYGVLRLSTTNIDSNLYNSYNSNDLRKRVYFRSSTPNWYFKGNYSGTSFRQFSGPATDEMYLTRAESYARSGNKDAALADLNTLLKKRWSNSVQYIDVTAGTADEALAKILAERRKELIFRGMRWIDLRRLNQDPRFAVTLIRKLNGQTFTLPPNDKKYTYPIPDVEIQLSGLEQNPR
ncbi:MAG TPA: RagB/SusD family nutrient uptake outer membrane protein [Chitinophagaceae bacterium]|nr:RagB/SusD family nutrient uptake outer membrane protein [Chitinophagaceae bacterium]